MKEFYTKIEDMKNKKLRVIGIMVIMYIAIGIFLLIIMNK